MSLQFLTLGTLLTEGKQFHLFLFSLLNTNTQQSTAFKGEFMWVSRWRAQPIAMCKVWRWEWFMAGARTSLTLPVPGPGNWDPAGSRVNPQDLLKLPYYLQWDPSCKGSHDPPKTGSSNCGQRQSHATTGDISHSIPNNTPFILLWTSWISTSLDKQNLNSAAPW